MNARTSASNLWADIIPFERFEALVRAFKRIYGRDPKPVEMREFLKQYVKAPQFKKSLWDELIKLGVDILKDPATYFMFGTTSLLVPSKGTAQDWDAKVSDIESLVWDPDYITRDQERRKQLKEEFTSPEIGESFGMKSHGTDVSVNVKIRKPIVEVNENIEYIEETNERILKVIFDSLEEANQETIETIFDSKTDTR